MEKATNTNRNIKLYSYYRSSCSYRVRIALYLKNIPFQYIPIHLLKNGGEQNSESYKKLNPEGKVPCLTHNSHTITQTMAILQYLEDICPRPALFPHPLKTQIIGISEIVNSSIQPLQNLNVLKYLKKRWQITEFEKKKWIQFWIQEGLSSVEKKIQENKQSPFTLGRSLTAAELFIIPQIHNARRFNVNLKNFPRLLILEKICQALPAFQKAHPDVQPDSPRK